MIKNIYIIFFLCLLIIGCTNPFTTRGIEDPDSNQKSDIYDSPTDHETVFSNLKYALEQQNVVNYMNCFVDTSANAPLPFQFIHDPSIESFGLANWSLFDERNYINKVFQLATKITFEYVDSPGSQEIANSIDLAETRYFRYRLTIEIDTEQIYTGKARMKLVKNDLSLWAIHTWEDIRDETENPDTWSKLKSKYRN